MKHIAKPKGNPVVTSGTKAKGRPSLSRGEKAKDRPKRGGCRKCGSR